jgi:hypothetical protein
MAIAEIPKDVLQVQLAKSLEVAERLYDILVNKAKIIVNRRWSFPAGTPNQLLANFVIGDEFADFPVIIYIQGRSINADLFVDIFRTSLTGGSELDDIRNAFIFNNHVTTIKTVLRKGDKIKVIVANISTTQPATGSVLVAITKALPVT